jgi:ribonucleoside-diphosphate reductase alpha chain
MRFINEESKYASEMLSKERGVFQNWRHSVWRLKGRRMRNATTTTIAPTGSLSLIAGCSSGVEPLFGICFIRNILDNAQLVEVNPFFEEACKKHDIYSEELMAEVAKKGSLHDIEAIPSALRRVFVTAHDIVPEWHIRMQAAFQKYTDNAVSKTVNLPNEATTKDVERIYILAYELGCKGVTVYRDGSRQVQVLKKDTLVPAKAKITDEGTIVSKDELHAGYNPRCPTCTI